MKENCVLQSLLNEYFFLPFFKFGENKGVKINSERI